jgi:hypothetical protein
MSPLHAEETVSNHPTLALAAEIVFALALTVGCVLLIVVVPTSF